MTVEKYAGEISFVCDDCHNERESFSGEEGLTFQGAWARLKEDGWRTKKNPHDGTWEHFGPACVRAFAADPDQQAEREQKRWRDRVEGGVGESQ